MMGDYFVALLLAMTEIVTASAAKFSVIASAAKQSGLLRQFASSLRSSQ